MGHYEFESWTISCLTAVVGIQSVSEALSLARWKLLLGFGSVLLCSPTLRLVLSACRRWCWACRRRGGRPPRDAGTCSGKVSPCCRWSRKWSMRKSRPTSSAWGVKTPIRSSLFWRLWMGELHFFCFEQCCFYQTSVHSLRVLVMGGLFRVAACWVLSRNYGVVTCENFPWRHDSKEAALHRIKGTNAIVTVPRLLQSCRPV